MKIKDYIRDEILMPRLQKHEVLAVYDAERRYHDLCREMASDLITVVDASAGSIPAREAAIKALQDLGKRTGSKKRLLVYVPTMPPASNRDKMTDPFSVFGEIGDSFPRTAGDQFDQLCLRAKADQATEIRKVFAENTNPSFELIDSIGSGGGWPALRAVLGVESTREIIVALLAPTKAQQQRLEAENSWISEAMELIRRNFGVEIKTKMKEHASIRQELWRTLLFSEFTFDLPVALPAALASVPKAIAEARQLVYSVCECLRNTNTIQPTYIDMAQQVEDEMNLRSICGGIVDLGIRDTFPFEERSFFTQCLASIDRDDVDECRAILARSTCSVWSGLGESQMQWSIVGSIVSLIEACGDAERELPRYVASQDKLLFFYINQFYKVDLLHREFEHAVFAIFDLDPKLQPAIDQARRVYLELASKVQKVFIKHLETAGWPPSGMLSSTEIFDKAVAPALSESGRRVAYFLIDALRYELGVELEKELAGEGQTNLQAAFSVIPTVTPIGMTSLLPGAQAELRLAKKGSDVVPMMGDKEIKNVTHRMEWIKGKYGQRFRETKLTEVIKSNFHETIDDSVELLVVRSSSMDGRMETDYEFGLPSMVKDLQRIRVALRRLRDMGFQLAVIATDHGFCINPTPNAGDTCTKPSGTWKTLHDRCLLGDGTADVHNWVLSAEHMGLKSEYSQVAGPRGLASYSAGNQYFHGGASLQEAVVPMISVKLSQEPQEAENIRFQLSYKRGSTRITTKLPVFELSATLTDLFTSQPMYDVLIQAVAPDGSIVGEPKSGGPVNAATGTVSVEAGSSQKVTIKMSMQYEGKFTVKVLNPNTLTVHDQLELETDYLV